MQKQRERNRQLTDLRIKQAKERKAKAEEEKVKRILQSTTESRIHTRRQVLINKIEHRRKIVLWATLVTLFSRTNRMIKQYKIFKPCLSNYWQLLYPSLRIIIKYRVYRKKKARAVIRKFVMAKIARIRIMSKNRSADILNMFLSSLVSMIDLRSVVRRFIYKGIIKNIFSK